MAMPAKASSAVLAWALLIGSCCYRLASAGAVTGETFLWRHDSLCASASPASSAGQFRITHKQSSCSSFRAGNYSWLDTVRSAVTNDAQRYRYVVSRLDAAGTLTPSDVDVPLRPSGLGKTNDFVMEGELGTPPQKFVAYMDTGSDLVWISCAGCSACNSGGDSLFDPKGSSTLQNVACNEGLCEGDEFCFCGSDGNCQFEVLYGDETRASGPLLSDTLTLGAGAAQQSFAFGCAQAADSPNVPLTSGIVGLGCGDLSLVSQTAAQYQKKFSYCLPSYYANGASSKLTLGAATASGAATTALLLQGSTFYFVGIAGISVDDEPVQTQADTIIVDSGTVFTRLPSGMYEPFLNSFLQKAQSKGLSRVSTSSDLYDACFQIPANGADVPKVALQFSDGAEVALTDQQTLIPESDDGSVACLAFLQASDSVSIFGNFQQQNMLVTYDVTGTKISFVQQNSCS